MELQFGPALIWLGSLHVAFPFVLAYFIDENMRRLLANGFVQQEIMALEEQMRDDGLKMKQRRTKMASRRRKDYVPRKNLGGVRVMDVECLIGDAVEWRSLKTCCGFVRENRELSALMVDVSAMHICPEHTQKRVEKKVQQQQQQWQQPQGVLMPRLAAPATMTALKKHQLYLNRALLNGDLQYANPIPAALTVPQAEKPNKPTDAAATVLDLSEKLSDFSKGLVQRVAESNKFSDNSSDSGYEELSSLPEVGFGYGG